MGLGFIGQEIARAALQSEELEVIGAVDKSPSLAGKKLSDVLGIPAGTFKISQTIGQAVGRRAGVVLLHATGSKLPQVTDQVLEALSHGMHVVSTCEELAFPWFNHPQLAEKLDAAAQRAGTTVIGTGINPGFVMDRLVATLGQVCGPVRHARVSRIVDARTRREALQRKVGAGLTEDEFFALVDKDLVGHVGLVESTALCALGLGLDCDDFEEELTPVFAEEDITGGAFSVKAGRVAGMHQVAVGLAEGQERVRLELTIAVGAENPGDVIEIDAEPAVRVAIPGGLSGDRATANLVVNAAPRITAAQPGLLTVLELPAAR
jgi:4-hydroxy-tetrahydrodipicolinate reductase